MVLNNTPFEMYKIEGQEIWVKREDLCYPYPGPSFSKIRGIESFLKQQLGNIFTPSHIGVVDSVHSKAGWGVSYICEKMGIPCTVYYPKLKSESEGYMRDYQRKCKEEFGANIVSLPATKSAVLYYQARRLFNKKYPKGILLPNGLKLHQTVAATARELIDYTPVDLMNRTWVVSVSSGTIAAGVYAGLLSVGFHGTLIIHLGYSRSHAEVIHYIRRMAGNNLVNSRDIELLIIDEEYEYKECVEYDCPFPCNPYYDLKAWKWIVENLDSDDVVFWNIGA
jgi:1-aminocyclopropane-1-carboxylate deaminase/D-cysteine desulfhydrase-like pyridoxal-dependent ACC family enzyme